MATGRAISPATSRSTRRSWPPPAAARRLLGRLRRVRFTANIDEQGERWREAVREHELILDALRRRAGGELADLLFAHLRSTKDAILRNLAAK